MKRLIYQLAISIILSIITMQTTYSNSSILVGGQFQSIIDAKKSQPFILQSTDNGENWHATVLNLLVDSRSLQFNTINCFEQTCLATGSYIVWDPYGKGKIFLLSSQDGGINWKVINEIKDLPSEMLYIVLNLNCYDNTCLAFGAYETSNTIRRVILASSDHGDNWENITNIDLSPWLSGMTSLTCTDKQCTALGNIAPQSGFQGFLMTSQDKGWSWKTNTSITNLPFTDNYYYESVQCNNHKCLVNGTQTSYPSKPFFLTSDDDGQNWSYVSNIPTPKTFFDGRIHQVLCRDNHCIAAGSYEEKVDGQQFGSGICYPYALTSDDYGKSWSLTNNLITLPTNFLTSQILKISCTDKACIIVGNIATGEVWRTREYAPLVLVGFPSGNNGWVITNQHLILPNLKNMQLTNIACTNDKCFITGSYVDNQGHKQMLILGSKNAGGVWEQVNKVEGLPINNSSSSDVISATNKNSLGSVASFVRNHCISWDLKRDH